MPGLKTRIWFEGNRVGTWEIACAELCGLGHYRMKGFVTVDTAEDFQKWMAEQVSAQEAEQSADRAGRGGPRLGPDAGERRRRKGRQFLSTVAVPARAHAVHAGVHAAPTSFWRKYIFSLDHKVIGKQYLLYALAMLVVGGLLAILVR